MSVENAQNRLIEVREAIKDDLKDYPMIELGIGTKLSQCIATLGFIGNLNLVSNQTAELPPVTDFMGEPLNLPEEVTEETLTPQEIDRRNLIAKIDVLEASLATSSNDQILESYKLDQNVIRGLAKRAGLEDFKTAEITEPYVESVRQGIIAKDASEKAAAEFEATI